jgi:RIO-like serine/threonine protein kinase
MTPESKRVLLAMHRKNRVSEWLIDEICPRANMTRDECLSAMRSLVKLKLVEGNRIHVETSKTLTGYKLTAQGLRQIAFMSNAFKSIRSAA